MVSLSDQQQQQVSPPYQGLILTNTDTIRKFLTSASNDRNLSEEFQQTASNLCSRSTVPYRSLKALYLASHPSTRPELIQLFSGSGFVFPTPKPREKSEELKERLRQLAEREERRAYQELVKDITPRKNVNEPFSTYKDQLGFGIHVIVTMFTCFLVGYASFRALFSHDPVMSAAGGILGLVLGMLVETLLFIIRYSGDDLRPPSSVSHVKKNQ